MTAVTRNPLPPPDLLPTLAHRLLRKCRHVARLRLVATDFEEAEVAALSAIFSCAGISQRDLAGALSVDGYSTGLLCRRLEERGLIERKVAEGDKRARALFLTAAGFATLRVLRRRMDIADRDVLRSLTGAERSQFMALLTKVALQGT